MRGLFKNFPFTEHWQLEFRAEFFNVLKRVNFNHPGTNAVVSDTNTKFASGGFGTSGSAFDPRIGQLALKLIF